MTEKIYAYIGESMRNGIGLDRELGTSYRVIDWEGNWLGNATKGSTWRVNSYIGTHMHQFYARINGREYTGRGFGEGMSIVLKETADSKRSREAIARIGAKRGQALKRLAQK